MTTRRELLGLGVRATAALAVGPLVAACAPASAPAPTTATPAATAATPAATTAPTLAPPETKTIRLNCAACDSPIMAAERYLRDEGFTDVQISDAATPAAIAAGKGDVGNVFQSAFANAVRNGPKMVGLGGIHPGCIEIWAQQGISSLKDLRGRTFVVRAKAITDLAYTYTAVVLKQAGVDPKDVNFVVQADADPLRLYLDGKNDAVFVATTGAAALKANPANKGKMIHSQVMDEPWKNLTCCTLAASEDWYRANPIAARRALRAIYRAADALPADRNDAAKLATDKGLFGGAPNFALVREAANMVPLDWRTSDPEKSLRFHAPLYTDTGLLSVTGDELAKALDLRIWKELGTELKK